MAEGGARGEEGSGRSRRVVRVLLVSLVVLVAVFVVLVRAAFEVSTPGTELPISRLSGLVEDRRVASATLLDQDAQVVGRFCPRPAVASACPVGLASFHAAYPESDVATQQLIDRFGAGVPLVIDHQAGKAVVRLVVTFVMPLLVLANLFGLIFVVASSGGESAVAGVAGFGRLGRKQKRKRAAEEEVSFANVAGADEAVAELQEVIDYLKDPSRFESFGAVAPKGVLLFGSPGCGKTLMARAVAGESGVPFVSASGTEFVESLVGVGAARVRDLFSQVRELAPAIVFIDEIDAVGRRREGEGVSGGEREQTLNQLLVEMDGFEVTSGVVLMGATNRPDILDPALLRPGRFDRHITLAPPDAEGRAAILAVHAAKRPLEPDVDLSEVARRTPGFTGADLQNVVNEAALLAVREGRAGGQIGPSHFSEAIQRVLHGPHQGKLMTPQERRRLAVHEAGHAVVAAALGHGEEIHRVSILARGAGLGQTSAGNADRVLLTDQEIAQRLAIAMAGSAAERTTYDNTSTIAEDDLAQATALAKQMVGLFGMSEGIGPVTVLHRNGGYLGTSATLDAIGEQTITAFDSEVRRLIEQARHTATDIIVAQRPALEAIATHLQQEENLEGQALQRLLADITPHQPDPDRHNAPPNPTDERLADEP